MKMYDLVLGIFRGARVALAVAKNVALGGVKVLGAGAGAVAIIGCPNPTSEPTLTAPRAVENLAASAGVHEVTLSWTNPDNAEITVSYEGHDNVPAGKDGYTATGLVGGKEYTFSVTANKDGLKTTAAPAKATAGKNTQEIAAEEAAAEKQAFDTWIDQPERKAIILQGVLEPNISDNDRDSLKNDAYPYGFPLNYFETPHTFNDAKQDLSQRETPIVKAPALKTKQGANVQYLASVNKRNQAIVKNSRIHTA